MKLFKALQYVEAVKKCKHIVFSKTACHLLDAAASRGLDSVDALRQAVLRDCTLLHKCRDFDDIVAISADWDQDAGGNYRVLTTESGLAHGIWLFPELEDLGEQIALVTDFTIEPLVEPKQTITVDFGKFIDEMLED